MAVARVGARVLLLVSLTQMAIRVSLVMAELSFVPTLPPRGLLLVPPMGSPLKAPAGSPYESPPGPPFESPPGPPIEAPPGKSPAKSPTNSTSGSPVSRVRKGGSNVGAIVGGVIAGVVVTVLVTLGVWRYCLKKTAESVEVAENGKMPLPTTSTAQANSPTRLAPADPEWRDKMEGLNALVPVGGPEPWPAPGPAAGAPRLLVVKDPAHPDVDYHNLDVRQYSYEEVTAISRNWMYKLGEGGFGTVYYGEIFSDTDPNAGPRKVALKRLSATSQQGKNEFLNEVRLLSRIHFRYLVPFLGFCDEINNQVFIYEYVQEGSLADWLHGAQRGHPDFNWYNRLLIALHAALGLEYLHVGARPNIIHRDVKSSNILITKDWEGRVADFGLSKAGGISDEDQRRTHMTTLVKGTPGYLDPEYSKTAKLTTKSDVYSFGIVLLELVTGRFPINFSEDDPQLRCIENYVQNHYPHNLATVADRDLKGNYDMRSMQKIVNVALRSVASQGILRPTMSDVVGEIRSAKKLMEQGHETSNTTHVLEEILAGTEPGLPTRNPSGLAPKQPRSRRGSSSSVSQSTGSSSATSAPSSVAFPR